MGSYVTELGGTTVDMSGMVDIGDDGEEDLLGAYLLEGEAATGMERAILGAVAKASPKVKAALQAARASKATMVREQMPSKSRQQPIGLDSGPIAVPAGAAAVIQVVPQKPFRPERLVVDPATSPAFIINSVFVGTDNQFVTAGGISANIFVPGAFGVGLKGDTANVGITIAVNITNFSGAAARFLGALLGTAVGYN